LLYHLLYPYTTSFPVLNILKYISFRAAACTLTAMFISFILGPKFIRWLKSKQKQGQPIRTDGPESHLVTKVGTPTMGGGLMLLSLSISMLLWGNLTDSYIWVLMLVTLGFGILGGVDDYIKLTKMNANGMTSRMKFVCQLVIAFAASYWIVKLSPEGIATKLAIPFFKDVLLDFGGFFVIFMMAVIVGSSNAVNLTDGLDGLAIVPVIITALCFGIIAYLVGNLIFSNYLQLNHVPGSGEIAVFCGAMIGAGLGFLWFNAPPAQVFMGDTGALALGGALGTIAVITKHELVLFIIGGLFVLETVSVMIQVLYFKMTGKRVFLMAPIHHHFEKKGWKEPTIVIRFWIISFILALIGMTTLKLR